MWSNYQTWYLCIWW